MQYFIQGPDLEKLGRYSDQLLARMQTIPGVADPDSTLRSGKPEVRLEIDRPAAADLGVSVMDIEQALNTLVAGQVASTFNAGEDQYDVRVRAEEQFRGGIAGLRKMTVPSNKRGSVGLDEVVKHRSRYRTVGGESHQPAASGYASLATCCRAVRKPPFSQGMTKAAQDDSHGPRISHRSHRRFQGT